MRMKLVFNEEWAETTAGPGAFVTYGFRANSVYDCDVSLGGNRATYLSTMGSIYNYYKVYASTIFIEAINNDTDDPLRVTVVPTTDNNVPAVANKEAIPGLAGCREMTVVNQAGRGVISNYARTADVHGVKDIDDVSFQAGVGANPATVWYWTVSIWNESGNTLSAYMRVKVVYDVVFTGLNQDAQGI